MKVKIRFRSICIKHFNDCVWLMVAYESFHSPDNIESASRISALMQVRKQLQNKTEGKLKLPVWVTMSIDLTTVVAVYKSFELWYNKMPEASKSIMLEDFLNNAVREYDQSGFFRMLKSQIMPTN